MLLSSDTHRKPITSITAVLLQFVTYLLTLPRIFENDSNPVSHNKDFVELILVRVLQTT
jgi:hypothetical protein